MICPQDGTQLRPPAENDPDLSAKYTFLSTIGEGGMGVIYKARQIVLKKIVAIKMIHPHLCNAKTLSRLQVEGRAAGVLSHPSIVAVHDCGVTQNGQPYLVMDYVEGATLAEILRKEGSLSAQRVVSLTLQICDALAHSHSKSVLHRDLKPSNIMIVLADDGTEKIRIMDFGIAKIIDDTEGGAVQQLTRTGEAVGSPLYMSPEQCRGKSVDHRSDLYSLGCVMYECLTGAPPLMGNNVLETMMMHMNTKPIALSEATLGNRPSEHLEQTVMRLLEKDPDDRFQSMTDLQSNLRGVRDTTFGAPAQITTTDNDQSRTSPNQRQESLRGRGKNQLMAGAGVCLLLFAIVIAFKLNSIPTANTTATRAHTDTAAEKLVKTPAQKSATKQSDKLDTKVDTLAEKNNPILDADIITERIKSKLKSSDPTFDFQQEFSHWPLGVALTNEELQPFENASFLKSLILPLQNDVSDKGLVHLSKLHLETLDLNHAKVKTLAALKQMTSLTDLNLSFTELDSSGIAIVAGLPKLNNLNLKHTSIGGSDLLQLRSMHSLRKINIALCENIDIAEALKFKKEMSRCEVRIGDAELLMSTGKGLIISARKMFTAETQAKPRIAERKEDAFADFKEADMNFAKAIALLNLERPLKKQILIECLYGRAQCYLEQYKYQRALDFIDQGLTIARQISEQSSILNFLERKNFALEQLGEWEKVVQNRKQIDQIYRSTHQLNLTVLQNREQLAATYISRVGKSEPAINLLKEVLTDYESLNKHGSPESGSAEQLLGNAYRSSNQFNQAVPHYLRAIKIFNQAHRPDRQRDVQINLADAYKSLHHYREEEATRKELLMSLPDGLERKNQLAQLQECQAQLQQAQ